MSIDRRPATRAAREGVAHSGVWAEVEEWLSGKDRKSTEVHVVLVQANILHSKGKIDLHKDLPEAELTTKIREEVEEAKLVNAWYKGVLTVEKRKPQYSLFENKFLRRLLAVEEAKIDRKLYPDPRVRTAYAHINAGLKLSEMALPRSRPHR